MGLCCRSAGATVLQMGQSTPRTSAAENASNEVDGLLAKALRACASSESDEAAAQYHSVPPSLLSGLHGSPWHDLGTSSPAKGSDPAASPWRLAWRCFEITSLHVHALIRRVQMDKVRACGDS